MLRPLLIVLLSSSLSASPGFAARISVTVDLSQQTMTVRVGGETLYNWAVSTGRKGYRTPTGTYQPTRMHQRVLLAEIRQRADAVLDLLPRRLRHPRHHDLSAGRHRLARLRPARPRQRRDAVRAGHRTGTDNTIIRIQPQSNRRRRAAGPDAHRTGRARGREIVAGMTTSPGRRCADQGRRSRSGSMATPRGSAFAQDVEVDGQATNGPTRRVLDAAGATAMSASRMRHADVGRQPGLGRRRTITGGTPE